MNALALQEQPAATTAPSALNAALGDTPAFTSLAPGYWPDVPSEQWNDWKWQLKNRVTTLAQLEQHLVLTPSERAGVLVAGSKLSLAVTPHFFQPHRTGKSRLSDPAAGVASAGRVADDPFRDG